MPKRNSPHLRHADRNRISKALHGLATAARETAISQIPAAAAREKQLPRPGRNGTNKLAQVLLDAARDGYSLRDAAAEVCKAVIDATLHGIIDAGCDIGKHRDCTTAMIADKLAHEVDKPGGLNDLLLQHAAAAEKASQCAASTTAKPGPVRIAPASKHRS